MDRITLDLTPHQARTLLALLDTTDAFRLSRTSKFTQAQQEIRTAGVAESLRSQLARKKIPTE